MSRVVLEGLLLLDKPAGPTSHDAVDLIRRAIRQRRVGHAGTLDPMATGLLPLVLGRATRLVRFLPHEPKSYTGRIRLGSTTSTDDVTGDVLTRYAGPMPEPSQVSTAARRFVGKLDQRAPLISAKRVAGERLYRLARSGEAVSAPTTPVEVRRFDLGPTDRPDEYAFEAEVSSGTYIRSLARDLGEALECGGTLAALRRTRIGLWGVEDALALDPANPPSAETLAAATVSLERIPLALEPLRLTAEEQVRKFALGASLEIAEPAVCGARYSVLSPSGSLLGIAEAAAGRLQPKVVLAGGE